MEVAGFACAARLAEDRYANRFVEGVPEAFRGERRALASVRMRHAIIDEIVADALVENPGLRIVVIGAGYDSRAFRMGGGDWVEVDRGEVMEEKEERLPQADCANPLIRIDLGNELPSWEGRVLVVAEGVLMYLEEWEIEEMLGRLQSCYPGHALVCDLMDGDFVRTRAKSLADVVAGLGAPFSGVEDPGALVERCGYRMVEAKSIPVEALRERRGAVAAWVARRWVPGLEGYRVGVYEDFGQAGAERDRPQLG